MLKKLNLIIIFTIFLAIALFITTLILNITYEKKILKTQLNILHTSIKDEYKKRLKESVNQTIMFIDILYKNKKSNNKKNEEDLRAYLYTNTLDKSRYTWINKIVNFKGGDDYAIRLIHPNLKHTEGSFLSTEIEDIKGNKPYKEELNGVKKNNEIYFTYYFKQLNKDIITEKLSFAKLYKKFNWVIVTGIPVNTLNNIISKEKIKIEESYENHLIKIISLRVLILILFILLLLLLKRKLTDIFKENINLNEQLEKRLVQAETKFDKFFELPINILLVSNFDNNILQTNSGWNKILAYKEEDLKNQSFLDFIHIKDLNSTKMKLETLKQKEETLYFENRVKHKDGTYRNLIWSITSIPEKKLFYAVAQDLTELKQKSDLMYQQSKMAALGEMTANIAHQWRQPLSIISTSSSGIVLKKMTDDLDDEFLISTMNQITKSTQYLSETIEDFRNFYSPNKEKHQFKIEDIINKTLNLIKKRLETSDIKIHTNIENMTIRNYENEILQVLINLLNNARDQLLQVDTSNKLIIINAYTKEDKIYIEVIDNGLGIKGDIINRIFEPYFTTKDKSVGTGIGLYMSEEIVNKHLEGELIVENHKFEFKNKQYLGAKFSMILNK